jgi:NADH-quinone oxidoreductase subunit J
VTIAELVFYLLAGLAIVAAIGVVTVPNVVHAGLFLILTLLGVAGFYILLSNEFLALVQVLVYAGAVSIILLFGLMLTRGQQNLPVVSAGGQWPIGLVVGIALAVVLTTAIIDSTWPRYVGEVTLVPLETLAAALFRDWLLPFELIGVVLLVALVGAIVIAYQEEGEA